MNHLSWTLKASQPGSNEYTVVSGRFWAHSSAASCRAFPSTVGTSSSTRGSKLGHQPRASRIAPGVLAHDPYLPLLNRRDSGARCSVAGAVSSGWRFGVPPGVGGACPRTVGHEVRAVGDE